MRFFSGLTEEEVAAVLDVTTRTVERKWRFARAWLRQALSADTKQHTRQPGHDV